MCIKWVVNPLETKVDVDSNKFPIILLWNHQQLFNELVEKNVAEDVLTMMQIPMDV